jgi:hypothetical protein
VRLFHVLGVNRGTGALVDARIFLSRAKAEQWRDEMVAKFPSDAWTIAEEE